MKKITLIQRKKLRIFNPKIKEECGVFGISNNTDAAALTALGTYMILNPQKAQANSPAAPGEGF